MRNIFFVNQTCERIEAISDWSKPISLQQNLDSFASTFSNGYLLNKCIEELNNRINGVLISVSLSRCCKQYAGLMSIQLLANSPIQMLDCVCSAATMLASNLVCLFFPQNTSMNITLVRQVIPLQICYMNLKYSKTMLLNYFWFIRWVWLKVCGPLACAWKFTQRLGGHFVDPVSSKRRSRIRTQYWNKRIQRIWLARNVGYLSGHASWSAWQSLPCF